MHDLSLLQELAALLPERASCRLSLNNLREDLGVAHKTVSHWMDVFERFYYHFRITPFATKTAASLRKEPKLYVWDWSVVEDAGNRFENMIASHLLKFVNFLYDTQGYKAMVHYMRDRDGREVDFLITINQKPWFAVEVKYSETAISPHLSYYMQRARIPFGYQVVATPGIHRIRDSIHVISASRFLAGLV
ncbi:DUF4143 domain-containing protein [Candidatus Uhrbacteria bacterium]|nr:DUF4143 domain-containing protein [Candidatus Uhrbacteria bacterium]